MTDLISRSINAASNLISEGRFDESEAVCRQILVVDESNPIAMRLLSCCLDRLGKFEESRKTLAEAERMAEGKAEVHNAMGIACMCARETDRKSTRLNSSHVSESRMPSSA